MNLKTVYEGVNVGQLGGYPDPEIKNRFGLRGVKFCKDAANLAGGTFKKGYPYHNKGGIAVLGEVYAHIQHPSGILLEIVLAESGPYYRTNGQIMANKELTYGYGPNISMGGKFFNDENLKLEAWTEEKLAEVIRKFLKA